MTTPPTAVLFDADGVLQRPGPTWRQDVADLIGPAAPAEVARFLDEVSAVETPTLTGDADLADTIQPVLRSWGVGSPTATVLALWDSIVVDPEMIAAVRALSARGVRCGLATNQHAQRAAYMRRTLGYEQVFDPLVYSCEVGLAKPDVGFFAYAVSALGCEPGEVLFVDDHEANVEGARAAGLRAEVFAADGGTPELQRILHAYELS